MNPGSMQLRLYRIARRDGVSRREACATSGISESEAALIDPEDARHPPGPECYQLPPSIVARMIGDLADTPLGQAAIERLGTG